MSKLDEDLAGRIAHNAQNQLRHLCELSARDITALRKAQESGES